MTKTYRDNLITNLSLTVSICGNLLIFSILLWVFIGPEATSFVEPIMLVVSLQLALVTNIASLILALIANWRQESKVVHRKIVFALSIFFPLITMLIVRWV